MSTLENLTPDLSTLSSMRASLRAAASVFIPQILSILRHTAAKASSLTNFHFLFRFSNRLSNDELLVLRGDIA